MSMIAKLLLLAVVLAGQAFAGATTTTFTNGSGDGLWSNPLNWDNGLPGGGITSVSIPVGFNVTLDFDSTSEGYNRVDVSGTLTITGSGVLSGPGVINEVGEWFLFTSTLQIEGSGVVNLQGGKLAYMDVVSGEFAGALVAYNPGTFLNALNNVIIDSGITLDLSQQPGAFCTLVQGTVPNPQDITSTISLGGLTVNGSVLIGSLDGTIAAALYTQGGSATVSGTGTITMGGSTQNSITVLTPGSTLTIGGPVESPGPLLVQGINGTISALGTAGDNTPSSLVVTPLGAIISDGDFLDTPGTLFLNVANWAIDGSVGSENGDALVLSASGTGTFDGSHAVEAASSSDFPFGTLNFPALFTNGGFLTITGGSWTYDGDGLLSSDNGTLSLGGSWSGKQNQVGLGFDFLPAIEANAGSAVNLGGLFYSTDAACLANESDGALINIVGVMDNAPSDNSSLYTFGEGISAIGLDLESEDDNLTWNLAGGTIVGGSLYDGTLHATDAGGTLNGVTVDDPEISFDPPTFLPGILAIDTSLNGGTPTCTITGSLTVNGTVTIGTTGGSPSAGIMVWQGSQTWYGGGSIVFGGSSFNAINEYASDSLTEQQLSATLTIGPGLIIDGDWGSITANAGAASMLINEGVIRAQGAAGSGQAITLDLTNWINLGTLSASSGSSLVINATGIGSNQQGIVTIGATPTLVSGLIATTDGSISFVGGGPWSTNVVQGVQVTNGSLTIGAVNDLTSGQQGINLAGTGDGSSVTLTLTGGTTAQAVEILNNSSGVSSVTIIGSLDNSESTLALGGDGGPSWFLGSGGQINSGLVTDGTLTVNASGASLINGVILDSSATLAIAAPGAACTVVGNMIINGTVQIGDADDAGQFNWDAQGGTATWGGFGQIVFANDGSSINDLSSQFSEGVPGLLFGDGDDALSLISGSGAITTAARDGFTINANSTISATGNATITFSGGRSFVIQGTLSASQGGIITGSLADDGSANIFGVLQAGLAEDETPSSITLSTPDLINAGAIATASGSVLTLTVGAWDNQSDGTIATISAGDVISIVSSGTGTNDGGATAVSFSTLVITGGSWTNNGSIAATDASVLLGGSWTNNPAGEVPGVMTGIASSFSLGGSFSVEEFTAIALTSNSPGDCTIQLIGTLDGTPGDANPFTGGIVDLSYQAFNLNFDGPLNPPTWLLDGGTLANLTLTDNSGSGLALVVSTDDPPSQLASPNDTVYGDNPGTLNNVIVGQAAGDTVLLDLSINQGATCKVANNLIVNASIQLGGVVNIEDSSNSALVWMGSQHWGGAGAIDFGALSTNTIADGNGNPEVPQILTIDLPLTINAGSGTIAATSPGAQLVNNGTITTESGSVAAGLAPLDSTTMTIDLGGGNFFTTGSSGVLTIAPGTAILVNGNYQQSGTLNVSIGTPNSPPAIPSSQTLNALDVTGFSGISSGSIIVNAVPGYPPVGGATNATFTVLTSIGEFDGLFSGRSTGAGIPASLQYSADALDQVLSVQIVQPAVGISFPEGQLANTNAAAISFQVTSSDAIYFPDASLIAVTGGTITSALPTAIGSASSTFTVVVTASGPGTVTLSLPAGAASDASGVPSLASNSLSAVFDNTPILATITPSGTSTNSNHIQFTLTFSKALFGPPTVTSSGGIAPAVITGSASPSLYFATITAAGGGSPATPVTVSLATTGAVDAEGNNLASAVSATVTYDTVAPTLVITPNGTLTNAASIPFTLTFSKPVALTAAGLIPANGALGALSGGPTVWTVPVGTTVPTGTISLTALGFPSVNAAVDLAGNVLAAPVTASVTRDTTAPAVVSFTPSGTATNLSPIPFAITFTTTVALDASGVTVTNGTLTALSPGPAGSYTL